MDRILLTRLRFFWSYKSSLDLTQTAMTKWSGMERTRWAAQKWINGKVQTHNHGTVPRRHQRQPLSKHSYHNLQWCLHSHMVQTRVSLAQQKTVERGCWAEMSCYPMQCVLPPLYPNLTENLTLVMQSPCQTEGVQKTEINAFPNKSTKYKFEHNYCCNPQIHCCTSKATAEMY